MFHFFALRVWYYGLIWVVLCESVCVLAASHKPPKRWQLPHEQWLFNVYIEGLPLGRVEIKAGRYYPYSRPDSLYCALIRARNTGLSRWMYKWRGEWLSCFEPQSFYPRLFRRILAEAEYHKYEITHFCPRKQQAEVQSGAYKQEALGAPVKRYEVPCNVQDFVSAFYVFLHQWPLNTEPLKVSTLPVFLGDSVFYTQLRYQGTESIKNTYYGRTLAYVFSPTLTSFSTFAHQDAIRMWLSRDAQRVPLRVEMKLKIFTMRMELVGVRPGLRKRKR